MRFSCESLPVLRAFAAALLLAACSANGSSTSPPGDDAGGSLSGGVSGAAGAAVGGSAGSAGSAGVGTSGSGNGVAGSNAGTAGAGATSGDAGASGAGVAGNNSVGGASSTAGAAGSGAGASNAGSSGTGAGGSGAGGSGAGSGGSSAGSGGSSGSSAGSGGSSAGTGGSSGGGNLPPSVTGLFPGVDATGVCNDAPLTITFSTAPSVGTAGKISIFAASNPNTAVDSIDVATGPYTDKIGGQATAYNLVRPVFIDGNSAVVYFHQHKLAANTKYFVTVTSGTFVNAQKNPIGTVAANAWSFTTGPAPTATASMSVDRTGSAPFCTVQGAFDVIPNNSTTAHTITVQPGIYHEIIYVAGGKKNITLHGADRAGTVIQYANNDMLNGGTTLRNTFYANGTTGLSIENLTIYNTTPQDGSQAEALRVQADQVILRNANFKSLQDTLDLSGRVYAVGSYIEGNVDFVWGSGVAYFDQCELKTVGRSGAIVQARNGNTGYGYVFVDSKLTAGSGVANQILARIDATAYPYSHVAYINCQMTAIAPKGWTITPTGASTANLRFWEYQSTDASGKALDVSQRVVSQASAANAALMRDKATVLGGWNPQ